MGSQIRNKSPDDHTAAFAFSLAAFAFSLGLLLRSCFSVELL